MNNEVDGPSAPNGSERKLNIQESTHGPLIVQHQTIFSKGNKSDENPWLQKKNVLLRSAPSSTTRKLVIAYEKPL
jgi:hypothetical protein